MFRVRIIFAVAVAALVAYSSAAFAKDLKIGLASEPTSIDPHFHNLSPNNALASILQLFAVRPVAYFYQQ